MQKYQQLEQQILHQLQDLPTPLLDEILHFTLFIKQQRLKSNQSTLPSTSSNTAMMLADLGGSDPQADAAPRRQSELG
ncbi:MAG: hypothetical protein HQL49_03845 [Gammaproteobacteria bacterium]|nr:hypothetical protein [Gammaproteobacteria bacterium]